jgi:hypothetical protein
MRIRPYFIAGFLGILAGMVVSLIVLKSQLIQIPVSTIQAVEEYKWRSAMRYGYFLPAGWPDDKYAWVSRNDVSLVVAFARAEEQAWSKQGHYVELGELAEYGFGGKELGLLRAVVERQGNSDESQQEPARVKLFLPYDSQSYVLLIYQHRLPYWSDMTKTGGPSINFQSLMVMSPGMWNLAKSHPKEFPKISDEESAMLLSECPGYKKFLSDFHLKFDDEKNDMHSHDRS